MTEDESIARIMRLVEVEFWKRDLTTSAIASLQEEYNQLISDIPDGAKRDRLMEKLALKNRYNYLINDTGILDSTGYGGNFY